MTRLEVPGQTDRERVEIPTRFHVDGSDATRPESQALRYRLALELTGGPIAHFGRPADRLTCRGEVIATAVRRGELDRISDLLTPAEWGFLETIRTKVADAADGIDGNRAQRRAERKRRRKPARGRRG